MIRLTPYEQRMLDGEFGAAKQVALQKIIDYAQILVIKYNKLRKFKTA